MRWSDSSRIALCVCALLCWLPQPVSSFFHQIQGGFLGSHTERGRVLSRRETGTIPVTRGKDTRSVLLHSVAESLLDLSELGDETAEREKGKEGLMEEEGDEEDLLLLGPPEATETGLEEASTLVLEAHREVSQRLTVDLEDLGLLCGVKTLVGDLKEAVSKFDMKAEGARGFLLQFVRTLSKAAGATDRQRAVVEALGAHLPRRLRALRADVGTRPLAFGRSRHEMAAFIRENRERAPKKRKSRSYLRTCRDAEIVRVFAETAVSSGQKYSHDEVTEAIERAEAKDRARDRELRLLKAAASLKKKKKSGEETAAEQEARGRKPYAPFDYGWELPEGHEEEQEEEIEVIEQEREGEEDREESQEEMEEAESSTEDSHNDDGAEEEYGTEEAAEKEEEEDGGGMGWLTASRSALRDEMSRQRGGNEVSAAETKNDKEASTGKGKVEFRTTSSEAAAAAASAQASASSERLSNRGQASASDSDEETAQIEKERQRAAEGERKVAKFQLEVKNMAKDEMIEFLRKNSDLVPDKSKLLQDIAVGRLQRQPRQELENTCMLVYAQKVGAVQNTDMMSKKELLRALRTQISDADRLEMDGRTVTLKSLASLPVAELREVVRNLASQKQQKKLSEEDLLARRLEVLPAFMQEKFEIWQKDALVGWLKANQRIFPTVYQKYKEKEINKMSARELGGKVRGCLVDALMEARAAKKAKEQLLLERRQEREAETRRAVEEIRRQEEREEEERRKEQQREEERRKEQQREEERRREAQREEEERKRETEREEQEKIKSEEEREAKKDDGESNENPYGSLTKKDCLQLLTLLHKFVRSELISISSSVTEALEQKYKKDRASEKEKGAARIPPAQPGTLEMRRVLKRLRLEELRGLVRLAVSRSDLAAETGEGLSRSDLLEELQDPSNTEVLSQAAQGDPKSLSFLTGEGAQGRLQQQSDAHLRAAYVAMCRVARSTEDSPELSSAEEAARDLEEDIMKGNVGVGPSMRPDEMSRKELESMALLLSVYLPSTVPRNEDGSILYKKMSTTDLRKAVRDALDEALVQSVNGMSREDLLTSMVADMDKFSSFLDPSLRTREGLEAKETTELRHLLLQLMATRTDRERSMRAFGPDGAVQTFAAGHAGGVESRQERAKEVFMDMQTREHPNLVGELKLRAEEAEPDESAETFAGEEEETEALLRERWGETMLPVQEMIYKKVLEKDDEEGSEYAIADLGHSELVDLVVAHRDHLQDAQVKVSQEALAGESMESLREMGAVGLMRAADKSTREPVMETLSDAMHSLGPSLFLAQTGLTSEMKSRLPWKLSPFPSSEERRKNKFAEAELSQEDTENCEALLSILRTFSLPRLSSIHSLLIEATQRELRAYEELHTREAAANEAAENPTHDTFSASVGRPDKKSPPKDPALEELEKLYERRVPQNAAPAWASRDKRKRAKVETPPPITEEERESLMRILEREDEATAYESQVEDGSQHLVAESIEGGEERGQKGEENRTAAVEPKEREEKETGEEGEERRENKNESSSSVLSDLGVNREGAEEALTQLCGGDLSVLSNAAASLFEKEEEEEEEEGVEGEKEMSEDREDLQTDMDGEVAADDVSTFSSVLSGLSDEEIGLLLLELSEGRDPSEFALSEEEEKSLQEALQAEEAGELDVRGLGMENSGEAISESESVSVEETDRSVEGEEAEVEEVGKEEDEEGMQTEVQLTEEAEQEEGEEAGDMEEHLLVLSDREAEERLLAAEREEMGEDETEIVEGFEEETAPVESGTVGIQIEGGEEEEEDSAEGECWWTDGEEQEAQTQVEEEEEEEYEFNEDDFETVEEAEMMAEQERRHTASWEYETDGRESAEEEDAEGDGETEGEIEDKWASAWRDLKTAESPTDEVDEESLIASHPAAIEWLSLGLSPSSVASVLSLVGSQSVPTDVQRLAVPLLLSGGKGNSLEEREGETGREGGGQGLAFAAQTGSGKTFAFLLPLFQTLREEEKKSGFLRRPRHPRMIVLAPTRELAQQVFEVAKALCKGPLKLSCASLIGGDDIGKQRKELQRQVDVVVGTPSRVLLHWMKGNMAMGSVRSLVVDEVDTMMLQGFGSDVMQLVQPLCVPRGEGEGSPSSAGAPESEKGAGAKRVVLREDRQLILSTATLTAAARKLLEADKLPSIKFAEVPGLHLGVSSVRHDFVETKGRDKLEVLRELLKGKLAADSQAERKGKPKPKTLVFCNTIKSCRAVEHALREMDMPSLSYHGEIPPAERKDNFDLFAGRKETMELALEREGLFDEEEEEGEGWGEGEGRIGGARRGKARRKDDAHLHNLLVCTDIAARGLDLPNVDRVVLFDFPLNSVDYIHRAGRTGRCGKKGNVISLIARRDKVLATAIQRAIKARKPLDSLSSSKRDYATDKAPKPAGATGEKGDRETGGGKASKAAVSENAPKNPNVGKHVRRSGFHGPKTVAWHRERAERLQERKRAQTTGRGAGKHAPPARGQQKHKANKSAREKVKKQINRQKGRPGR
uniref:Helicase ATP-binding domain-containing protein n=1 Tax=Chromera velia CCMP2878 TaxID=1169474 RepID=A0A0G4I0T6_9ALVE|eukprot:Cvel_10000.t1-p1 / transcript=Cvel_10000.t1 / gene=Cvel_10000 / organism=Chromera_velia_CCMP2878 / gene_product=DEAD-box ATP-dependent RNA helicase 39, putative / transcript_product=DEAD-box ATP-dependent RNA helicase 39, putative / location=Cvel_scaffold592:43025-62681(+) / protein_length=2503 / sequence_SO=supercontig / SO=protein_coding / is_pseudo=false